MVHQRNRQDYNQNQRGKEIRRRDIKRITAALIIFSFIFILAIVPAPASDIPGGKAVLTARESADPVALYKQYLKNMVDGKYEEVWNSTASGSKHTLARLIAQHTNGKATQEQVLDMLNKDENRIRTIYFDAFVKEGNPKKIYEEAVYNVKSSGEDHAWITISLNHEPKDFQILKEDGALKINFFEDLMK